MRARIPSLRWTRPPCIWFATITSVSSAAAAWPPARMQFVGVIGPNGRGFDTHIGCAFEKDLGDVACVSCGQCIVACPTGALR